MVAALLCCLQIAWFSPLAIAHPSSEDKIIWLNRELESRPEDPTLILQRGIAHGEAGHLGEALRDFQRARKRGAGAQVDFHLGAMYFRLGNNPEAARHFNQVLAVKPRHAAALEHRARLHRDNGDIAAAVADYRMLFSIRERPNPGDYVAAAQLLAGASDESRMEALALLDAGIARLGAIPQLQQAAIRIEVERGTPAAAIDRLLTLEPSLGNSPEWMTQMGDLYMASGQARQAQAWWQRARESLTALRPTRARLALQARLDEMLPEAADGR